MAGKTCFVIMAIGAQTYGDRSYSYDELKEKYDSLIKEAISKARPGLEIVRADDISAPGTITTDIITRLMHSDYVVADVTFPNPNVFYELGLRHACKPGTVILKDRNGPSAPFDIAHLRHIDYENTTSGLRELSSRLATVFDHFDRSPDRPDNHLLELAKLTNYAFQNYEKVDTTPPEVKMLTAMFTSPKLMEMFVRQQQGEVLDQAELFRELASSKDILEPLVHAMAASGDFSLPKLLGGSNS